MLRPTATAPRVTRVAHVAVLALALSLAGTGVRPAGSVPATAADSTGVTPDAAPAGAGGFVVVEGDGFDGRHHPDIILSGRRADRVYFILARACCLQ